MPKINAKCFHYPPKLKLALPSTASAEDVASSFISLWFGIMGKDDEKTLKTDINNHIGPESDYTYKQELITSLFHINEIFSDKTHIKLSQDEKHAKLLTLKDRIPKCTTGLLIDSQQILEELYMPVCIDGLLLKIRNQIVEGVARRSFSQIGIHTYNKIFQIAQKKLRLNVTIPDENDPYSTEVPVDEGEIVTRLKAAFSQEYDSFNLLNRLIDTIKEALSLSGYNGRQYEYLASVTDRIKTVFESIFETKCFYPRLFVMDTSGMDMDDDELFTFKIVDINWLNVAYDLMDFLFKKSYFNASPEEQSFLMQVLSNQAQEFPDFYSDMINIVGFFKFTEHISPEKQLLLLNLLFSRIQSSASDGTKPYLEVLRLTSKLLTLDKKMLTENMQKIHQGKNYTAELKHILQTSNKLSILTILSWMELDVQQAIYKHIFPNGANLLIELAESQDDASLKKAIELLKNFPDDSQKEILAYKGPMFYQNFLSMSVLALRKKRHSVLIENILSLYLKHELLSDDVLVEAYPSGDNLLLWSMQFAPNSTLEILKLLLTKSKQTQQAVLLQLNQDGHSCLRLAVERGDRVLDGVVQLIMQHPPSIIYNILCQKVGEETNILIAALKYPDQLKNILQLFSKLDDVHRYQLLLLPTKSGFSTNILHFAINSPLDSFNLLLEEIVKFEPTGIKQLLQGEHVMNQNVLLESSLIDSEHMTFLIDKLVSKHHYLLDLLLPQFAQLLKNTIGHSSGAFARLLKCLGDFPEDVRKRNYDALYTELNPVNINPLKTQIISEHCLEQLITSNQNSRVISDILIKAAQCYKDEVNDCISALSSTQVESIYQNNQDMLYLSVGSNYFINLLEAFERHLSPEDFRKALCYQNRSRETNILSAALELSRQRGSDGEFLQLNIRKILSLEEGTLVEILNQNYEDKTQFLYVMYQFEPSIEVIHAYLGFDRKTKIALLTHHPATLSEILGANYSENHLLFSEILNLGLLEKFDLNRKDLQKAIKNLPNDLFKELLKLPAIKEILFNAEDDSLIFDMLESIHSEQEANIHQNITDLLDFISTLAFSSEEIESLLNVDNWCKLCCADLDNKEPLLYTFLSLIDCHQTKINLFTSQPEATDDYDDKIDNVFSRAMDLTRSILPILEAFLSLDPQADDIMQVFSLNRLYSYKYEENDAYDWMTVFYKCLDTRNQQENEFVFNMLTERLSDTKLYDVVGSTFEFFTLIVKKQPNLLATVCEFFKQKKDLLNRLMQGYMIENMYEIMSESLHDESLEPFFELIALLPDDILSTLCLESEYSSFMGLKKEKDKKYYIDYNLLETMLNFKEKQFLVINLLKSKSIQFIHKMIEGIAIQLAYKNPKAIFKEILALLNRFEFDTQFDILKEQDVYSSGSVENTICFLEHISHMSKKHHWYLLANFKWDDFFKYPEHELEVFFTWLTDREPAYKAMLLSKNTLMSAVDNPSIIVGLIDVVETLEIQDQIDLFNDFNEVLELKREKFTQEYQLEHHDAIQRIKSRAPKLVVKRSFNFFNEDQPTQQYNSEKHAKVDG